MGKSSNLVAYIYLLLTVTFWAGNFIVGKFASYYEVPPFSLNFYRWFFAWLILAPFWCQVGAMLGPLSRKIQSRFVATVTQHFNRERDGTHR